MKRPTSLFKSGFTIIELIIVIVIIGILATIVLVAYNGVQASARDKGVLSDLDALDGIETDYGLKNSVGGFAWYSGNGFNDSISFTPSSGNIIDVVVNSTDYCIRGYNPNSATYKTLATAAIKESTPGICTTLTPSLAAQGYITNLATNPSFEAATIGGDYSSYNSAPLAIVTSGCYHLTQCVSVDTSAGGYRGIICQPGANQPAGGTYVYSAYVKGPVGQSVTISARPTDTAGDYIGEGAGAQSYALSSSWQRVSTQPVTLPSNGDRPGFEIISTTSNTTPFEVDAVMITLGTTLYTYADGSSTGWVWNGVANTATSTGLPL